jgi:hypothetical protein
MSKTIGVKQAIQGLLTLGTKVNWDDVDGDDFQKMMEDKDGQLGQQFTHFLKNGGKVIIGKVQIIKIDRSEPFNPASFIGAGWTIWKGPIDGDGLTGEENQDKHSLALTELDLRKVQFRDMLKLNESAVKGEEVLERLVGTGYVSLDAKIFQTLWENLIFTSSFWEEQVVRGYSRVINFDGTILRNPSGGRFVLCMCWGGCRWNWHCSHLGNRRNANDFSVVLRK